ncbi:acid ceramidase-like [Palaemon carinicauda]|uniref:acid ceramidase-like n=1 Tax=Palaemon carinicauda TaxID=392227 RepID=UPI0035B620F5
MDSNVFQTSKMKTLFQLAACTFVILSLIHLVSSEEHVCETSAYPPDEKNLVPTYVVNLDLSPLQRWAPLVIEKRHMLHSLIDDVTDLMESLAGKKIFSTIMKNLDSLAATLPYPYYEEIIGIAGYSNLPPSVITMYNVFYEVFTLCTSIVAQDADGNIFHGRNLDTGLFLGWDKKNKTWKVAELLHPLTVNLQFEKEGKIIFESTSFVGYVGILTAVQKGSFSLSLNKRFSWNGGFMGLLEWILFEDHSQSWVSFLTREVMQEAKDYEDAKQILSKTRLLAPVYFILGGTKPGEGCIITRDRDHFELMNLWTTKNGSGSWYLVQTNYDHWKQAPFFDDRRTPANQCMVDGGAKNASVGLIYNVLSTKPVLNKETIYTTLMSAQSGEFSSWLRYCPDPCLPW